MEFSPRLLDFNCLVKGPVLGKNKHYVVAEHQNLLMVGVVPLSKGAVSSLLVSEFSK